MTRNILVTGAGGAAAISLLRALEGPGMRLFAADIDPHAAGLYMVPASRRFLLPRGDDPAFVSMLLRLCRLAEIDVLIPTVDCELLDIARAAARFEGTGTAVALSPPAALEHCLDKWALAQVCAGAVPLPRTEVLREETDTWSWTLPCIAKPRRGSGGRGVVVVEDQATLHALPRDGTMLLQALLPGQEYSVDVLVDAGGSVRAAVPRARLKVDSGVAVAARTLHDAELESLSAEVVRCTGVRGVVNIQWKRDPDGRPRLLEVNPRFPGTMPLTVAAGIDMPALAVAAALGEPIPEQPRHREVALVRRWEEIPVAPAELDALIASLTAA